MSIHFTADPATGAAACATLLVSAVLLALAMPVEAEVSPGDTAAPVRVLPVPRAGLDDRVKLLAAELGLDAHQRAEVRQVLTAQREETLRVWNDESMPASLRVQATQKISHLTADKIRALLSEEQRKKYIQPRSRDAEQNDTSADLDSWMRGKMPHDMRAPPQ